jgi:radical SAM protein with 4Fe4S-binding SPASM domain
MRDLMVYLKTTETCQLNCQHCFTSGTNGKKGWFDPDATIDFFRRLKEQFPTYRSANISFHGGEPMLCPLEKMEKVYDELDGLWDNLTWGIQTNLTYKLTDERLAFLKKVSGTSIGTSWDYSIRWQGNRHQEALWEENVRKLVAEGIDVTVMICVSKDLLAVEPIDLINKMIDLGVGFINFERITENGNARENTGIFPTNLELDAWFLKMWEQTLEHKAYEKILNMFLESLLTSTVFNTFSGCRSRECEQKILTLNADGTIGGCPNGAPETTFGKLDQTISEIMFSEGRGCNIANESTLNEICYSCDVFDVCNGDCHQLNWQGDICASPKSMMRAIKNTDQGQLKKVLNGFMGSEGMRYEKEPSALINDLITIPVVEVY